MRTSFMSTVLVAALALGNAGCLKSILLNGQLHSTRVGSGAADTVGDYEVAKHASMAALMQFEGLHRLAPNNEDGLFILVRGWTGYGYAFAQDDYEAATLIGDEPTAEYHKGRTRLAYDRAIGYGLELASRRDEGFKAAKKNADTLKAWLKEHFDEKEDAEMLFWTGSAWVGRVNLLKDEPEYVAELFVGVTLLERSRELDPEYFAYGATALLASYHARSPAAEMDEAKKLFDEAIAKTQRKSQGILLNYATRYACNKGDKDLYEKTLNEILTVEDPEPKLRLQNAIAKRRAKRALMKQAMEDCAFSG